MSDKPHYLRVFPKDGHKSTRDSLSLIAAVFEGERVERSGGGMFFRFVCDGIDNAITFYKHIVKQDMVLKDMQITWGGE